MSTSFNGSASGGYSLRVRSGSGIHKTFTELGSNLHIKASKARGELRVKAAGVVKRLFLRGARTVASDGIEVKLTVSTIEVIGLPDRTTSVSVSLQKGTVSGHGTASSTTALVGAPPASVTS